MPEPGEIALEIRDRIAWITLRRSERLNAFAGDMREQLRDRLVEAASDGDSLRAMVVTGEGRAFCAGGDVDTMARLRSENRSAEFRGLLHAGAECVLALQAFPALTIAAVNGVAAGAGLALALNCDLRVATPDARFIASWSRIGLAPDWGATYWLPRILGHSRAAAMVLSGSGMDAEEALATGLVHEIVDAADLLPRTEELAALQGDSPDAVRAIRRLLREGGDASLERSLAAETEAQEELFESEAVARGLRAFLARRKKAGRGDTPKG